MERGVSVEDIRIIILMKRDYTTESGNLGRRTFQAGRCYQVCPTMERELLASGAGEKLPPRTFHGIPAAPKRDRVAVRSKVTRWFSSNGLDTHHFTAGEESVVPSNLATLMLIHGYAEAA